MGQIGCVVVGFDGLDISRGEKIYVLALLWQLMDAYTLSQLAKVDSRKTTPGTKTTQKDVIAWYNDHSGDDIPEIKKFNDPSISDSHGFWNILKRMSCEYEEYHKIENDLDYSDKSEKARYQNA